MVQADSLPIRVSGERFYFNPTNNFVTQVPADSSPIEIVIGGILNIYQAFTSTSDFVGYYTLKAILLDQADARIDSITLTAPLTIRLYPRWSRIHSQGGSMNNLASGYRYAIGAKTDSVAPRINAQESGSAAEFRILGASGITTEVSFTDSPYFLWDSTHTDSIPFALNGTYCVETGEFWDPYFAHDVTIGPGGVTTIRVGISVVTPVMPKSSSYTGTVLMWTDGWVFPASYEITLQQNPTEVTGERNLPCDNVLHQNYPNPFNPTTMIRFSLAKTGNVTLKVFDILGREVKALLSDTELGIGQHEIQFDASNLPGGVYFYRIQTEGWAETKSLILMK